jgi:PLP dependent protein
MADLIEDIDPVHVRGEMAAVRAEVAAACDRAGRDPAEVEVVTASKYVGVDDMGLLAEAGIGLVGENRAQEMAAKAERWPGLFQFDFIGRLQSRKVKQVVPLARLIHSVASESVLVQLERHGTPETKVLVQVNFRPSSSGVRWKLSA